MSCKDLAFEMFNESLNCEVMKVYQLQVNSAHEVKETHRPSEKVFCIMSILNFESKPGMRIRILFKIHASWKQTKFVLLMHVFLWTLDFVIHFVVCWYDDTRLNERCVCLNLALMGNFQSCVIWMLIQALRECMVSGCKLVTTTGGWVFFVYVCVLICVQVLE